MKAYNIVTMNGIEMIDVLAINRTNIAKAYCTTRKGGVSTGTTAYMNCNLYKSFDLENGQKNFRIFCRAIGIDPQKVITNRLNANTEICRYVSSNDIIDIYNEPLAPRADGLITDCRDITLYMYASDCAVIMLLDIEKQCIGMIHVGWRGSLNNIIPNTVYAMINKFGTNTNNLIAVICPSISSEYFEVDESIAQLFSKKGYDNFIDRTALKPHIDLYGVNKTILEKNGILPNNLSIINLCTFSRSDLFHSYRRGPIDENGIHLNGVNGMFLKLI